MLGHGRLPLGELIQSFQRLGYSGYYEIELQGAGIEQLDYRQLLNESRRTTGQWQSLHGSKT
jgi:sugar phosphate isomerase/epimerase